MADLQEVQCPKALLQRKVMWCAAVDNFCAWQRHCNVKGHAVLTDKAKTCLYRDKPNKQTNKQVNSM